MSVNAGDVEYISVGPLCTRRAHLRVGSRFASPHGTAIPWGFLFFLSFFTSTLLFTSAGSNLAEVLCPWRFLGGFERVSLGICMLDSDPTHFQ